MQIDAADGKIAVTSGRLIRLWSIKTFERCNKTIFQASEIPAPASPTVPLGSPNATHARSVDFLPRIGSVIVSFVEDDVHGSSSNL
jgi:hypothetical protein